MEVTYVLIGISFEKVVEITRSKFSNSIMTVLTSLGGSVGTKPKLYSVKKTRSMIFAKGCLLNGQEQVCTRITHLFVRLFVVTENGPIHN